MRKTIFKVMEETLMKPVEEKTLSKPKGVTVSRAGFFYFSDLTFR